ncbi:hypothetical protein Tco_1540897 [Tanacetum coccineum]
MGHSSGRDSAHSSSYGSATIEDDSPVEEVTRVKAKKVSKRASKVKMTNNKDTSKPWTTTKEIALCKAWCNVSKNSVKGDAMKIKGSAQGGLNLNDEADDYEEEVRKERPTGCDRDKKKASSSSRSEYSSVAGVDFVELVANKWKSIKSASCEKKEITRLLSTVEESGVRYPGCCASGAAELKREELTLQHQTLELALKKKQDKDFLFNSRIDETLPQDNNNIS